MSEIVAVRKPKAIRPKTQKLWQRASRLKNENESLKATLDQLVQRVQQEILPHEKNMAESQMPLCIKLLSLGQRKTLAKWQRQTLHDWILEMFEGFHAFGLVDDELRNHMARYDAFRLGVELEDDEAPYEELGKKLAQFEKEAQRREEEERQQEAEVLEEERAQYIAEGRQSIERELDKQLGRRPEKSENGTGDLWEDDLDAEIQQLQEAYDRKREQYRKVLLDELQEEADYVFGDEDDDFDDMNFEAFERLFTERFEETFFGSEREQAKPEQETGIPLDNGTLQRLFRATAAKLHPDREPDPELRSKKQRLMATLLKARKKGDIITVMELYNTWVGEQERLNKADEKSLQAAIEQWLVVLDRERDEIIATSPMHHHVYDEYYDRSKRKIDQAFRARIDDISEAAEASLTLGAQLSTLKSLKPVLERRFEYNRWSLGY